MTHLFFCLNGPPNQTKYFHIPSKPSQHKAANNRNNGLSLLNLKKKSNLPSFIFSNSISERYRYIYAHKRNYEKHFRITCKDEIEC